MASNATLWLNLTVSVHYSCPTPLPPPMWPVRGSFRVYQQYINSQLGGKMHIAAVLMVAAEFAPLRRCGTVLKNAGVVDCDLRPFAEAQDCPRKQSGSDWHHFEFLCYCPVPNCCLCASLTNQAFFWGCYVVIRCITDVVAASCPLFGQVWGDRFRLMLFGPALSAAVTALVL